MWLSKEAGALTALLRNHLTFWSVFKRRPFATAFAFAVRASAIVTLLKVAVFVVIYY